MNHEWDEEKDGIVSVGLLFNALADSCLTELSSVIVTFSVLWSFLHRLVFDLLAPLSLCFLDLDCGSWSLLITVARGKLRFICSNLL